jgi:SAM-dependent methyltransferase
LTGFNKYIAINKIACNKRTPIHLESNFYNHDEFMKGMNSLKSIELDAIGNVKDKSLLHLQCHFGQDSISFVKMGAEVTAVDFSDVAINEAKKISKQINININFIESDVLELQLNKEFDIVFSSYGAIGWLPNLDKWAVTIAAHLKKGGMFLLTEFHPFLEIIKDNGSDYFYKTNPDVEIGNGTYTDGGSVLVTKTCWWNHSLTSIFSALESNGLILTHFEEFDYSPFLLEGMIEKEKEKYILESRKMRSTPYVFNLKATKK